MSILQSQNFVRKTSMYLHKKSIIFAMEIIYAVSRSTAAAKTIIYDKI